MKISLFKPRVIGPLGFLVLYLLFAQGVHFVATDDFAGTYRYIFLPILGLVLVITGIFIARARHKKKERHWQFDTTLDVETLLLIFLAAYILGPRFLAAPVTFLCKEPFYGRAIYADSMQSWSFRHTYLLNQISPSTKTIEIHDITAGNIGKLLLQMHYGDTLSITGRSCSTGVAVDSIEKLNANKLVERTR